MVTTVVVIVTTALVTLTSHAEGLRLSKRVVGGAEIANWCDSPFTSMVALQFPAQFSPITFCSGVLISDRYVVTTAKCILTMVEMQRNDRVPMAVVGERDLVMQREPGEQRVGISSFKIHMYYNRTTGSDNIGLIQLARPVMFSRCAKPAARMEKDANACPDVDDSCQMAGWGSFVDGYQPTNSKLPRSAQVTVYSDVITTLLTASTNEVPSLGSVYAESFNPAQKACFFDWGGLVTCRRNGHDVFRGIIGDHNCNSQTTYPIMVVDIPFYQSWLDQCTASWTNCPSVS